MILTVTSFQNTNVLDNNIIETKTKLIKNIPENYKEKLSIRATEEIETKELNNQLLSFSTELQEKSYYAGSTNLVYKLDDSDIQVPLVNTVNDLISGGVINSETVTATYYKNDEIKGSRSVLLDNEFSYYGYAVISSVEGGSDFGGNNNTSYRFRVEADGGVYEESQCLNKFFRQEKITTICFDNETYANTGGQESGATNKGQVFKMAPTGKKFDKVPIWELAKVSGCHYSVNITASAPKAIGKVVREAVMVARKVGPTFINIYTPCILEIGLSAHEGLGEMKDKDKERFQLYKWVSPEAEEEIKRCKEEGLI